MSYAENTTVSAERSKAEIETILKTYGADQFASGWSADQVIIGFRMGNRMIRFSLPVPKVGDFKTFQIERRSRSGYVSQHTRTRTELGQKDAHDQEIRRRWRALALVIKAKLEAVRSGITSFEEEFLAHIILPGGRTVYEETRLGIKQAYDSGKSEGLLLGFSSGMKPNDAR